MILKDILLINHPNAPHNGRLHTKAKSMNRNFNTNTKNHDEWLTPPYIIESLGKFDLDPCAPIDSTRPWDTALRHYTLEDDGGLNKAWHGRVWCNPPYGRQTFDWLDKLADHGNGIALIFSRTETIGFHRSVWNKADSVFFFKGRLKFHRIDGTKADTANAPSCLIAYGHDNTLSIKRAMSSGKITGHLVANETED